MSGKTEVPAIDAEQNPDPELEPKATGQELSRIEEIEIRILDAEARSMENGNRETDQRLWLRYVAVAVCIAIIIGMGCMLSHVVHKLMTLKTFGAQSAYIIAIYVTPILSMSGLSIALLVSAFRGFKEGDGDASTKAIAEGTKAAKLMQ